MEGRMKKGEEKSSIKSFHEKTCLSSRNFPPKKKNNFLQEFKIKNIIFFL